MTFEEIKTLADWIRYAEEKTGSRKEAVYHYMDLEGNYCYTVLRLSGKKFRCGMIDGDKFIGKLAKPRKDFNAIYTPNEIRLKRAAETKKIICITEGEKDADTLNEYGFAVFTCGSPGSWTNAANDLLKDCPVVILADNDDLGKDSANNIAASLKDTAKSIKVIIPCPETEGADITDYFNDHSIEDFLNLVSSAEEYTPAAAADPVQLCKVSDIKERETEWLIPGYMPKCQITIIAGDGGSGKTSIVCDIAAAITTGTQSILTRDIIPADFGKTDPGNVLFLSGEDDFSMVLIRRLRNSGADLERIYTVPIGADGFNDIKLGSGTLESIIAKSKAQLVILDPLQQFLPFNVDMSRRNEMRQCLSSLIGYGKKYKSTFLIVCHSNKQSNNSGRKRIADSADIWDISRSVLIAGETGEGSTKYLSHEKSNCGERQQTIIYDLDGKNVLFRGRTEKRDADFIRKDRTGRAAPARKEAKDLIIKTLESNNGKMNSNDLDRIMMSECGMSEGTLKRAKAELKAADIIRYSKQEFSSIWETELLITNN